MSYNVTRIDAWRCTMDEKEKELHEKKMKADLKETLRVLHSFQKYNDAVREARLMTSKRRRKQV